MKPPTEYPKPPISPALAEYLRKKLPELRLEGLLQEREQEALPALPTLTIGEPEDGEPEDDDEDEEPVPDLQEEEHMLKRRFLPAPNTIDNPRDRDWDRMMAEARYYPPRVPTYWERQEEARQAALEFRFPVPRLTLPDCAHQGCSKRDPCVFCSPNPVTLDTG